MKNKGKKEKLDVEIRFGDSSFSLNTLLNKIFIFKFYL